MALMDLISVQSKVKLALKTVGLSLDEKTAIDSLISRLANNGISDMLFPEQIDNVEQLIEAVMTKKEAGAEISEGQLSFAHRVLSSEHGRSAVANFAYTQLSLLPADQRSHIAKALTKLSDLPLYEKGSFTDEKDFIANGLLKSVDSRFIQPKLPSQNEDLGDANLLMQCPDCHFVFIPQRHK